MDDLTHYGAHRWGWASTKPGDVLEIKVRAAAALVHPTAMSSSASSSILNTSSFLLLGLHAVPHAGTSPTLHVCVIVQVDTRNPVLASPSMRVVLGVGMLMSYEGMGTGMLECVRGCHCPVLHLDCNWDKPMSIKARLHAHTPDFKPARSGTFCSERVAGGALMLARTGQGYTACASFEVSAKRCNHWCSERPQEWWHIKVTQASECVLRLTNAQATSSGGPLFAL